VLLDRLRADGPGGRPLRAEWIEPAAEWSSHMTRFLSLIAVVLLSTNYSLAQSAPDAAQCDQIRQAVVTYGYVAAKRHAMVNYGSEAVKAGERCLTKRDRIKG